MSNTSKAAVATLEKWPVTSRWASYSAHSTIPTEKEISGRLTDQHLAQNGPAERRKSAMRSLPHIRRLATGEEKEKIDLVLLSARVRGRAGFNVGCKAWADRAEQAGSGLSFTAIPAVALPSARASLAHAARPAITTPDRPPSAPRLD